MDNSDIALILIVALMIVVCLFIRQVGNDIKEIVKLEEIEFNEKHEKYVAGTKELIRVMRESREEIDESTLPKNYIDIRIDDLQVAVAKRYLLKYSDMDMEQFIEDEFNIYMEENASKEVKK